MIVLTTLNIDQLFGTKLISELIIGYNKTCKGVINKDDRKTERAGTMATGDSSAGSSNKNAMQEMMMFEN